MGHKLCVGLCKAVRVVSRANYGLRNVLIWGRVRITGAICAILVKRGRRLSEAGWLQKGSAFNNRGASLSKGALVFFNGVLVYGDVHFSTDRGN